jgi:hypothetical protein
VPNSWRKRLPTWDEAAGKIDMYDRNYGTLAMYQVGGPRGTRANKATAGRPSSTRRSLEKDGCQEGSWTRWTRGVKKAAALHSTAVPTLCLEVYYRFPKVFGAKGSGKGEGKPAPKDGDKKRIPRGVGDRRRGRADDPGVRVPCLEI